MNVDFSNTWRDKHIAAGEEFKQYCIDKSISKEEAFIMVINDVKEVSWDDVMAQFIGHMIVNNKE